ncbi:hypothetical protein HY972_00800 [Candidatus Kaiserbacteria bacterium]|nr:hypothetical protein [Candidatus Kaiserbacteria bacterium]
MNRIAATIRSKNSKSHKLVLELDADRLERLAASFGLFNPEFLASVTRAEADYHAGRSHRVHMPSKIRAA